MGIISDAGCPGVADPGAMIVAHISREYSSTIGGSIFHTLALMASGMNGQNFAFNGYLPIDKQERKKKLNA